MYDLEMEEVLSNILNEMIMASKYIFSLFIEVLCDGSSIRPSVWQVLVVVVVVISFLILKLQYNHTNSPCIEK